MIDFVDCYNRTSGWCSVHKMENMWREMHAIIGRKKPDEDVIGVELGVFGARSIIPVAHLMKERGVKGMFYGIDPWATHRATEGYEGSQHEAWWRSVDMPAILKCAHGAVRHWHLHDYVTLITSTGERAKTLFDPNTIDFFHCDAQHTFQQFRQDIDNYLPLCRSGAAIIIDDVGWVGGKEAAGYVAHFCDYKYTIDDCGFFIKK